jgi:AcrR family transcriptional regulator
MAAPGTDQETAQPTRKPPNHLGRKRDDSRDLEILRATLDILTETGYEGMTIDMVAARAKAGKATVYRRWATKGDLVIAAMAGVMERGLELDGLPDTGTLREDLLALITPRWLGASHQRLKLMAALASMLSHSPDLAAAAHKALVEPSAAVYRRLLQRAVDRGEVSAGTDITTLALIIPAMTSYQVMFAKGPVDRAFLQAVIDGVLLPAVSCHPSSGRDEEIRL